MMKNNSVFTVIALFVFSSHLCIAYFLAFEEKKEIFLQPKIQKLVVQTIKIKNKAPSTLVSAPMEVKTQIPVSTKKLNPQPNLKPKIPTKEKTEVSKKEGLKKEVLKKEVEKNIPSTKKNEDSKKKLLRMAQESLAKIEKRSDNLELNTIKSEKLGKLEKISGLKSIADSVTDSNSKNQLCAQLRSFLKLPEYGEVEIKLSLDKTGKVVALKVIETKSDRNKKYIEELLPRLTFSLNGIDFGKEHVKIYNITLTNE